MRLRQPSPNKAASTTPSGLKVLKGGDGTDQLQKDIQDLALNPALYVDI
jgi:hypothetical protein